MQLQIRGWNKPSLVRVMPASSNARKCCYLRFTRRLHELSNGIVPCSAVPVVAGGETHCDTLFIITVAMQSMCTLSLM